MRRSNTFAASRDPRRWRSRLPKVDLRAYVLHEDFDAIVSIGLLMFFDCPTASAQLSALQAHVRPGGVAVVNVLTEGTTYHGMFDPAGHCLFGRNELLDRFAGWDMLRAEQQDFAAPRTRRSSHSRR